ncbi:MAG: hypothetical protein ABI960_08300 [Candidatus Eisenbacteria bacterium]
MTDSDGTTGLLTEIRDTVQRVVPVMILVVTILIGYVSWLLLRIMHR